MEIGTDLKDFHLFSKPDRDGHQTAKDVFDSKIVSYLIEHFDMMIYNNVLYIYKNGYYIKDKDGRKAKALIKALMYDEFKTSIRINRVYNLLMCENSIVVEEEDLNVFPRHWINFKNGMLDVLTEELHEHDPVYKAINQIPHNYVKQEENKKLMFCQFIESRIPDAEDRQMFYEFFAYCLTIDVSFQKMLYLLGTGGCGKSLMLEYVNHIVGYENISHLSPQKLGQRFQSVYLMNKLLNSVSDISSKSLKNTDLIKQLTGDDAIPAEYKGGDSFSFYNTAKMLFSANKMPMVEDEDSNGYYRRLMILTIKGDKYFPNLVKLIHEQDESFIYFLIQHLKNAYKRGCLFESRASKGKVAGIRYDSDTVQAFIDDCLVEAPGKRPKRIEVFDYYERYCSAEKLDSLGRNDFYASMEAKGIGRVKCSGYECFKDVAISNGIVYLG